jgi:uncharacterized protein YqgV (UPF0045/DUF77 family)
LACVGGATHGVDSLSFAITDERAFAFLTSLQQQFEQYSKLILLSIEQADCVKNTDEDRLLKVLEDKQKCIDLVDKLSSEFKDEKALLEQTPMGEFSCIDPEIDEVLKAIEKALQKLIENETRDMEAIKSFQTDHHEKMEHLHKGKNIAEAYLKPKGRTNMDRSV